MSKVEDKGAQGWQAPHMATHTPMQVPRPAEAVSAGAFHHPMQQTRCFPSPFGGVPTQQPLLFHPTWPQHNAAQWPVPSGGAQHDWDKWSASQLLMNRATAPLAPVTIVKDEKEEGDSTSYDVSASQSPSDAEEARGDHGDHGDDHIDVEETETLVLTPSGNETTSEEPQQPQPEETPMEVEATHQVPPTEEKQLPQEDEATKLLLNFSQQSFMSPADQARIAFAPSAAEAADFVQSQLSAFSALEQNQQSHQSPTTNEGASFCRPPGLGPAAVPTTPTGPNTLVCQICGFSSTSKFHYNSHMNTHGDHQCTMCDYTSRTEGRLKKHMKDSHTVEEQLAAGLEIDPKSPTVKPDTSALSTTMASLVDTATALANGGEFNIEQAVTTLAAAMNDNPGLTSPGLNTTANSGLPSALEQIRAFTEKNPLLPEGGGLNLANALDQIGQFNEENKEKLNLCNSEPRRNSNGKIKQLKCKQCPHISYSKNDQWAHARTHIPSEKQMNCPQCNFVTEYKHHLEYHIRNHLGSKPFQCKKCTYQCVNKSMLNSHMKSHTNVYQFRCMDCTYATKYCHSLKLHLKKYDHRRVPDGVELGDSPPHSQMNPLIKTENPTFNFGLGQFTPQRPPPPVTTLAQTLALTAPIVTSQSLNYASQMLLRQHQMEQINLMGLGLQPQLKCALCEYQCGSQEELMRHNVTHIMSTAGQSPIVSLYQSLPQMQQLLPLHTLTEASNNQVVDEHESGNAGDDEMEGSSGSTGSPGGSSKACDEERRKKGFKVDQIGERLLGKSPSGSECGSHCEVKHEAEEHMESSMSPPEPSSMLPMLPVSAASNFPFASSHDDKINLFRQACMAQLGNLLQNQQQQEDWRFQCHHCKMAFQEQALYHIHMGYHGYEHAFKCNRCGFLAPDSLSFNLHLLQASHE